MTETIPDLALLPVLRGPDECACYKKDAGKILPGAFGPRAKRWGMAGIHEGFVFDAFPPYFDRFEPILKATINRLPILADAGIHTFFSGPESFTPDDAYNPGPAPEVPNVWVAAGFNSVGIQSAGGASMAQAQWMDDGEAPFDLGDMDIARIQPFQRNRRYLRERATETLGLLYADHWPFRQKATARGVRRSPFHAQLDAMGAVFGELAGWERANWFAFPGEAREYSWDWGPQNRFANAAHEHALIRGGAGFYDMSSFGKLRIKGRDAEAFLNRVYGGDMSVDVGRIVYTQMLNSRAGVEADVTVTRLSETAWLMVTPAAMRVKDDAWLRRHLGDANVVITDVTAGKAVLAVMGPKSREVMRAISPGDFSTEAFPFGTAREIEAGLGFAVKTGTPADIIGRDAVLRKREEGLTRRMLQFRLRESHVMLYHNEPILRDGRIVGHVASGAHGHHPGGAMGLGYMPCADESVADLLGSDWSVEVAGRRVAADASFAPMYDPKGEQLKT